MTTATAPAAVTEPVEEATVESTETVETPAPVSGVSVKINATMTFEQMKFLYDNMGLDAIKAMGLEPAWNEANSKKVAADDASKAKTIIEGVAKSDLDEYMELTRKVAAKKEALSKLCAEKGVSITFIADGYSLRTKKEGEASATPKPSTNGNGAAKSTGNVPSIREACLAGIEAAGANGMSYAECQKHVQAVRGQDNTPSFNIHATLEGDVKAGRVHKAENGRWYA